MRGEAALGLDTDIRRGPTEGDSHGVAGTAEVVELEAVRDERSVDRPRVGKGGGRTTSAVIRER